MCGLCGCATRRSKFLYPLSKIIVNQGGLTVLGRHPGSILIKRHQTVNSHDLVYMFVRLVLFHVFLPSVARVRVIASVAVLRLHSVITPLVYS